jgi:hypothetical protein
VKRRLLMTTESKRSEVIDLCGGDVLCMETANLTVILHIEAGGKCTSTELKLCPRHLGVMEEHAKKRCREDRSLTIRFDVDGRQLIGRASSEIFGDDYVKF